jgi:hypothetical protein
MPLGHRSMHVEVRPATGWRGKELGSDMLTGPRLDSWPHDHLVHNWKRISRFDGSCKVSIGLFVGGWLLAGLFVNTLRQGMDILAVLPIAFFAVFLAAAWRGIFVGVYASETGVRVRTVERTVTLPWHEVAGFEVLPVRWKATEAIWVMRRHGPPVRTPIMAHGRWYGRIHGWKSLQRVPREDLDATINTLWWRHPDADPGRLDRR